MFGGGDYSREVSTHSTIRPHGNNDILDNL